MVLTVSVEPRNHETCQDSSNKRHKNHYEDTKMARPCWETPNESLTTVLRTNNVLHKLAKCPRDAFKFSTHVDTNNTRRAKQHLATELSKFGTNQQKRAVCLV
jgi:hypothetical protein